MRFAARGTLSDDPRHHLSLLIVSPLISLSLSLSRVCFACRYENAARQPDGALVISPPDSSAIIKGQLFSALSQAVYDEEGALLGVVAQSLPLESLNEMTQCQKIATSDQSRFYEGKCMKYSFIWHDNSDNDLFDHYGGENLGVLHRNYKESWRGQECFNGKLWDEVGLKAAPVVYLEAWCDEGFARSFQEGVLSKGRVTGTASFEWLDESMESFYGSGGSLETWHYSFSPVPGTQYMVATVTVQEEITRMCALLTSFLVSPCLPAPSACRAPSSPHPP